MARWTPRPPLRVITDPRPPPLVASSVMGTAMFVFTEIMLFAGLMSAFSIVKASALIWPPPGQPRLPVEATAVNTGALLLSGVLLYLSWRAYRREPARCRTLFAAAIGLGAFFVVFQGWEWVRLLGQGLTLVSSTHGSFFYLIVGLHGLHAVAALIALGIAYRRLLHHQLPASTFVAAQVFWYFVVGLWPILYFQVYL